MKKLFLILLILPIGLLADDWIFTVENTTMVTAYFNIFNAIAALFKNDSYIDLLRLAFLVGGFFVFAKGVLAAWEGSASANMLSPYGKYLAIGVALLTLIFSRTSTLWIEAKELPTYCPGAPTGTPSTTAFAVELPSVLAYVFKVTNTIGTELTYLAEAAFTNPSNPAGSAAMSDSDGYLGSLKATIGLLNINPSYVTLSKDDALTAEKATDFVQDFRMFYQSCITENNQNQGSEGRDQDYKIMNSKDIMQTIDAYIGSDSPDTGFKFSSGKYPGNVYTNIYGVPKTCRAVWANLKSTEGAIAKFASKMCSVHPNMNGGVFELITGTYGTGAALEMTGIGLQAGLINAIKASNKYDSIGVQGAGSFTAGESRAVTNLDQLSTASYMAEMIPYLQMTMRAVLYAFFPFVFVVVLLPGGLTVLTQYLQTMIWIELWTPTAAIVNMFINLKVKDTVGAEYSREGLTLMTSANMLSEANTIAGVGAVLYLSIPPLTWLILKGSGQMLGGMLSSHSAGFAKNLESNKRGEDVKVAESGRVQNNERASKNLAALSYGERTHYDSLREGNQLAGGTMASMNSGLQAEKSAAYQKTRSDLIEHLEWDKKRGGAESAAQARASHNLHQRDVNYETLKNQNLLNKDNSLNHEESNKLATVKSIEERNKNIESKAKQDVLGTGLEGRSNAEENANTKANEEDIKLKTDKIVQRLFSNEDRATQEAISKAFSISTTKEQFGSNLKEAFRQGGVAGTANRYKNREDEVYQRIIDEKTNADTLGQGRANTTNIEKNVQDRVGNDRIVDVSSTQKVVDIKAAGQIQDNNTEENMIKSKVFNDQTDISKNVGITNSLGGNSIDAGRIIGGSKEYDALKSHYSTSVLMENKSSENAGKIEGTNTLGDLNAKEQQQQNAQKNAFDTLYKKESVEAAYKRTIDNVTSPIDGKIKEIEDQIESDYGKYSLNGFINPERSVKKAKEANEELQGLYKAKEGLIAETTYKFAQNGNIHFNNETANHLASVAQSYTNQGAEAVTKGLLSRGAIDVETGAINTFNSLSEAEQRSSYTSSLGSESTYIDVNGTGKVTAIHDASGTANRIKTMIEDGTYRTSGNASGSFFSEYATTTFSEDSTINSAYNKFINNKFGLGASLIGNNIVNKTSSKNDLTDRAFNGN